MDAQRTERVKNRIKELGLTVSNVNAFTFFAWGDTYRPMWIEDDESHRRTRIDHTLRSIQLAKDFGAKTISLQPGGLLIATKISRELAGERFAAGLREVIPAAKAAGIIL